MATAIQETTDKTQIEGIAQARYTRVSPQKARLVIDLIRGRRAEEALHTLQFTKKRVAKEDSGETLDVDELFVTRCFVNEGPRWKRMRPAPMGRGFRYQKRTSHILVEVSEHHRAVTERAAAAAAEAQASKGVKGAIRKARKTLEQRNKPGQKKKK